MILFSASLMFTILTGVVTTVVAQGQKLVMVTSADYPPYEFRNTASGSDEIIGFDVDIAKYITKELGYQLEVKDTDFNGLIPALNRNGQILQWLV